MVLQLDPDEPEAEIRIRAALERRSSSDILAGFRETYASLRGMETLDDDYYAVERVVAMAHANQLTQDAITRAVLNAADLGVSVAVDQLGPIGFDWTLANIAARDWAQQHAGSLIRQIDDVTTRGVQQAVARWIENGEPLQSLIRDLEIYFSRERAEMIATTEVTNAFAQANEIAYQQSGVCQGMEWRTSMDERRCPTCAPLEGKRRKFGEEFAPGIMRPAAHPRCRCWVVGWLN